MIFVVKTCSKWRKFQPLWQKRKRSKFLKDEWVSAKLWCQEISPKQNLYRIQQPIGRPSFWGKEFLLAPSVGSFRIPNRKKTNTGKKDGRETAGFFGWSGDSGDFRSSLLCPKIFIIGETCHDFLRWVSVERLRLLHGTAEKTKYEETNPFRGTWAPIFSRILSWLGDTHNSEDWIEISEDWNFKILTTRMVLGFFKGDTYRLVHLGTVILVYILFTICLCFFRWYECH